MKRYISLFYVLCAMLLAGVDLMATLNPDIPSLQAKYITFSTTTSTSVKVGWTNGNGDGRIVVVRTDADFTNTDAAINSLAVAPGADADGAFTDGTITAPEIGETGSIMVDVVMGANKTTTVTGLAQGTTYYFKVYEFNYGGTIYKYRTSTGILNPRSKATVDGTYGPLTAVVSNDDESANVNGDWAKLSWASTMGNTCEWDMSIFKNVGTIVSPIWVVVEDLDEIDLGILGDTNPETYLTYIGAYGEYQAKVRARFVSGGTAQLGAWVTSSTFTLVEPQIAPKFDYTETTGFKYETNEVNSETVYTNGYVQIMFDVPVANTNATDGAYKADYALDQNYFRIFNFATNANGTATGASIWKAVEVGENENDGKIYNVYVRFDGRANGNETFQIAPAFNTNMPVGLNNQPGTSIASNYKIFGLNGVPMNPNDPNAVTKQVTNVITAPVATVLRYNTTPATNYSYVKIQDAFDDVTNDNDNIILKDNILYPENATFSKQYSISMNDDGVLESNASVQGMLTFDPSGVTPENVHFTIEGIDLLCNDIDAEHTISSAVKMLNGSLYLFNNNIQYDNGDKAIYIAKTVEKGIFNSIYIGKDYSDQNNMNKKNTFYRLGTTDAAYGIYVDEGVSISSPVTLDISYNEFAASNIETDGNDLDKAIYLFTNTCATHPTNLIIENNQFDAVKGDAIYFDKGELVNCGNEIFSTITVHNNVFNNTNYAIAYAPEKDFTTVMPFIDLLREADDQATPSVTEAYNEFFPTNKGICPGYYHDGSRREIFADEDPWNIIGYRPPFLDASWLAPGSVILSAVDTIDPETDHAYPTIATGYGAINTDGQWLWIMDESTYGTNDEPLNLNMNKNNSYTITGKTRTAKIIGSFEIASIVSKSVSIYDLTFDNMNINVENSFNPNIMYNGLTYESVNAPMPTLDIVGCDFNFTAGQFAIAATTSDINQANNIEGELTIDGCYFNKDVDLEPTPQAIAIFTGYNPVVGDGTLSIINNGFNFNSNGETIFPSYIDLGTKDIGILIPTITFADATGTYNIKNNQFVAPNLTSELAPEIFNGAGNAIVFSDFQFTNNVSQYNLSKAKINISNANVFANDGYGIMFIDQLNYDTQLPDVSIYTTLPTTIDLFDGNADPDMEYNTMGYDAEYNYTKLDGSKIYGAAWYDLTSTDETITSNSKLYPSIQEAIDVDLTEAVNIGAGYYKENVTIPTASNVTTLKGYYTAATTDVAEMPCSIYDNNYSLTINKDLVNPAEGETFRFFAPIVRITDEHGKLSDAVVLVKDNGTIGVDGSLAMTETSPLKINRRFDMNGNYNYSYTNQIPNYATFDNSMEIAIATDLSVTNPSHYGTEIGNFSFTKADQQIKFINNSNLVDIYSNNFAVPDNTSSIYFAKDFAYGNNMIIDNIFNYNSNTNASIGIECDAAQYYYSNNRQFDARGIRNSRGPIRSLSIYDNTFNMDGATAPAYDKGISIVTDNKVDSASSAFDITHNYFNSTLDNNVNVDLSNTTVAIYYTDSETETEPVNPSGMDATIVNGNEFNNNGYAFIFNNNAGDKPLCSYFESVTLGVENDANTFKLTDETNVFSLVAEYPFIGGYSDIPVSAATAIYTDCAPPADFEIGEVLAYTETESNKGTPAEYWNAYDTKLKVTIPINKLDGELDNSLVNGTIKVIASKDNWATTLNLGTPYHIVAGDIQENGSVTLEFSKEVFEALTGFDDNTTWQFNAIITDMASNAKTGTVPAASLPTIKVDRIVPNMIMTGPAHNAIMNGFTQFQGTYTELGGSGLETLEYALVRSDVKTENSNFHKYFTKTAEGDQWTSDVLVWNTIENIDAPALNQWNENIEISEHYYQWWVRGIDHAGNITNKLMNAPFGGDVYRAFRIDTTKPTVVKLDSIGTNKFLVEFSEEVQLSSAQVINNYDLRYNGDRVTLTSAVRLTADSSNRVILTFTSLTPIGQPVKTLAGEEVSVCETINLTVINVRDIALNKIDPAKDNTATYTKPDWAKPYVVSVTRKTPASLTSPYLTNAAQIEYQVVFNEKVRALASQMKDQFEVTSTNGIADISNVGTFVSAASSEDNGVTWTFVVNVSNIADGGRITIAPKTTNTIVDGPVCPINGTPNAFAQASHTYTPDYYIVDRKAPVVATGFITRPTTTDFWNASEQKILWDATKVTDGYSSNANTTLAFEYNYTTTPNWLTVAATNTVKANVLPAEFAWTPNLAANTTFSTSEVRVSATDEAGNTSTWFTSNQFTLDNVKPTVVIATSKSALNETDNAQSFTVTATFNENMLSTVTPTVAFDTDPTAGANKTLTLASSSWNIGTNKTVYTWTYTVADKDLNFNNVKITVAGANDLASNTMVSTDKTNAFSIDMQDPVLSNISIASNNTVSAYAKNGDKITVTFTADKALDLTANKTTATIAGQTATVSLVDDLTYKAEYTIPANEATISEGTLGFSIVAVSATGNTADAVTSVSGTGSTTSVTYDRTAPTVTITSPIANAHTNGTQNLVYTVTNEANASANTQAKIALGTLTNFASATAISSLNGWIATSTDDGTKTITVSHTDKAGNIGTATLSVVKDLAIPTVVIAVDKTQLNETHVGSNTFTVTATFNENMLSSVDPTIAFTPNPVTESTLSLASHSWNVETNKTVHTWIFNVADHNLNFDNVKITVAGAKDLAENAMVSTDKTNAFSIDMQDPILSNVSIASNNTATDYAKNGDKVTVTFTADKALDLAANTTTATIAGQTATVSLVSGTTYKAEFTIPANEATINEGLLAFSITAVSATGNTADAVTAVSGTGSTTSVTYDRTAPTVTIDGPAVDSYTNGTQILTYTVSNEANAATATQAKIGNGTLGNFSTNTAISSLAGWNATSTDDGNITITVSHTDKAGNVGTATRQVIKDVVAPVVTITAPAAGTRVNNRQITFTVTETNKSATTATAKTVYGAFASADLANTLGDWANVNDGATFTATIKHTDLAGNVGTVEVSLVKDVTAPTILSVSNTCGDLTHDINSFATVTLSEGVYANDNGTGAIDISDINYLSDGGNASLRENATTMSTVTDGATQFELFNQWNNTILGNEKLYVDGKLNSIYDQAGNKLVPTDLTNLDANDKYDYTKIYVAIGSHPQVKRTICPGENTSFSVSASGGLAMKYQWQKIAVGLNATIDANWTDLVNDATYSGVDFSTLSITNAPESINGLRYRAKLSNECQIKFTNLGTLEFNTALITQDINQFYNVCSGDNSNTDITVVATSNNAMTYTWERDANYGIGAANWVTVANGTPAGITYNTTIDGKLTVSGVLTASQSYRAKITTGGCASTPVYSRACTLKVIAKPTINNTITGGTICYNTAGSITIASSETTVQYQVKKVSDDSNVGTATLGNGTNLVLSVGNLTTTTAYKVTAIKVADVPNGILTNLCEVNLTNQATVTVNPVSVAGTASAVASTLCSGTGTTINLAGNTGTIQWNSSANGTDFTPINGATNAALNTGNLIASTWYKAVVTSGVCSTQESNVVKVTVNPNLTPTASLVTTSLPTTICFGGTVGTIGTNYDNNASATVASYTWYDNNNVIPSATSATYAPTDLSVGTHAFKAMVTFNNDPVNACLTSFAATTTEFTVTVNALATPTFVGVSDPSSANINNTIVYTTQSGKFDYTWVVSGTSGTDYTKTLGTSTDNTISITWLTDGAKTVSVNYKNTANGCPAAQATVHNVNVSNNQTAVAIANQPENVTICSGSATSFTASFTGNPTPTVARWEISTNNGTSFTTLTVAGVYSTTNNGFTLNVGDVSGLNGNQYRLVATNTLLVGGVKYATSNATILNVTTPATPTVTISAPNVTNGTLTVATSTQVIFTATPSNIGGGTVSYQWKRGVNNVGTNQNTYTVSDLVTNDVISCTITVNGGCVSHVPVNSNSITTTVLSAPAVGTLAVTNRGRNALTLTSTSPANSWVLIVASTSSIGWIPTNANEYADSLVYAYTGSTPLGGSGAAYVVYDGPATSNIVVTGLTRSTKYYFKQFAYNGIAGTPSTYIYNTTGVQTSSTTTLKESEEMLPGEKEFAGNFSISSVKPNPVSTDINFNINTNEADNYTIELFSMNGELVISQSQMLSAGNHAMKLDLVNQKGGVSAGTYFLKVTAGNESLTQKVVVMP